ncbi:FAD-dependent oxidoreductase [Paraburkholderia hayleyella]|uniref:FAD-dependent oxidoreductase n=1 Tax=Paraburkholderia hayleyella TaxID=2152889 RepID=UPI00129287DB|nr:FAD-dependent oxidoreductase [Paraburkholderia hayleyella]
MKPDYPSLRFAYQPCREQQAAPGAQTAEPYPVIVVGAGPVGLATALDLARQGVPVLLLDEGDALSSGSRAICFARRTLDIFDRLGCGQRMVDKGVSWNLGKVFVRDELVYAFDLLPEAGHRRPAFINLQQYYVEGYLLECAEARPEIEIRWGHKVSGIEPQHATQHAPACVHLVVTTPDDDTYTLRGRYVVAADGSRSTVRRLLGLDSVGRTFHDRFLIADVRMDAPFPAERWFWFDPPFHPNQSVLLHRQADNVWRIDFQLGWEADPVLEKTPERVLPRVRALLGAQAQFELQWVSVYTFACQRMARFRHGNVLFAGDAAHGVSPFGARGANSGVQDAENLAWKLALVLTGHASEALLDSYASEREFAADENIRHSTRATDFITPKSAVSRVFRDAVLTLARELPFARQLVNSGRLSLPAVLHDSVLNTADEACFAGALCPGAPCCDAPVLAAGAPDWLLGQMGGHFTVLLFSGPQGLEQEQQAAWEALETRLMRHQPQLPQLPQLPLRRVRLVMAAGPMVPDTAEIAGTAETARASGDSGALTLYDVEGLAALRYDARPGTVYLVRPDQHVCARWRQLDTAAMAQALRCIVQPQPTSDSTR